MLFFSFKKQLLAGEISSPKYNITLAYLISRKGNRQLSKFTVLSVCIFGFPPYEISSWLTNFHDTWYDYIVVENLSCAVLNFLVSSNNMAHASTL